MIFALLENLRLPRVLFTHKRDVLAPSTIFSTSLMGIEKSRLSPNSKMKSRWLSLSIILEKSQFFFRKHFMTKTWFLRLEIESWLQKICSLCLKKPNMSHLSFSILTFSTNFCPIKIELPGYTVRLQASGFQKIVKMDHFWHFSWTFVPSKYKRSSLRSQCFKIRNKIAYLRLNAIADS